MPLRRTLGLTALTFYAVGMILGAGIYSVIGAAAATAGDAVWISFALCAVVALFTGLSYAELTTMFPKAGAEYVYVREALRWPWLPVLIGTLLVLSGVATAATVTVAFAGYLGTFVDVPAPLVAAGLLVLFTGLNLLGLKQAAWLNIALTTIELGGLALVIVVAVTSTDVLDPLAASPTIHVLPAAAIVFFAFLGFENIASLAEEAREPERTMPRALLLGVAISSVLYVVVALAVVALAAPEALGDSDAPLATAVASASPTAARVLGAIALVATANTGLIALVSVSRVAYGMARDGDLPRPLARLSKRDTPWISALVMLGLALALLPLGGVEVIASLSSFGALTAFIAVDVAVIVLRRRAPRAKRPFRIPGAIGGVPVTAVLGAAGALVLLTQLRASTFAVGGAALAVGVAIYLLNRRTRGASGRRPRRRGRRPSDRTGRRPRCGGRA